MNILIINGPNLNMLGIREPEIYGYETYHNLIEKINLYSKEKDCHATFFQSNHEGKIIDYIQKHYKKIDALIINPGAFTHYSYAIRDCLSIVSVPIIEVHISNINERESFRKTSVIKDVVSQTIMGRGTQGYLDAIDILLEMNISKN